MRIAPATRRRVTDLGFADHDQMANMVVAFAGIVKQAADIAERNSQIAVGGRTGARRQALPIAI